MTAVARSTFGVAGAGVIGAGWAVRALGRGLDVVVHDPAPGAELRLRAAVDRAWPAVCRLGLHAGADPARLTFAHTLDEVATRSGFVQEAVPEDLDRKRAVLATIDAVADPDVIIASSTSGLRPTALQDGLRHPERLIVGHPFNPVYLLPLVEVVAGEVTAAATVACARAVYDDLDMHPLSCAARSTGSCRTACSRRCGGRCCTCSRRGWPRPPSSTTPSATGRGCGGRRWAPA